MLSLKSPELSGPKLGLGHDCRGGGVSVCGHVSVPGIELSDVGGGGGDLRLCGDTPCQASGSKVVREPYRLNLWSRRQRRSSSWLFS